ncbi:MAG: SUMF1/EgtB/PvdO family nonheme iron enzyme [Armatimonadetes bacterium]|nr:SUMF1/EgtB/PvdO family nonheme iron enzyme [Armatimonadota bacterium]
MGRVPALLAVIALCLCAVAQAAITIDTVAVGDVGNAPDTRYATPGFGSVGYTYKIGTYETTAGQYTAFLNAVAATDTYGLYNSQMWDSSEGCKIQRGGSSGGYGYSVASDWANRPVNFVSYWDSCRFANWLHNGQPIGFQDASTTERGAYNLDGYTGLDGRNIGRNTGWKWAIPSEDEYYKSAYYKSNGADAGYWDYPMQSDVATVPSNDLTNPDGGNNANCYMNHYTLGGPYWRTNVGEFENSESAYGTFDQSGNVSEWNEAIPFFTKTTASRGVRGGSYRSFLPYIRAESRGWLYPSLEQMDLGFRVAAVPEPSSLVVLAGGLMPLFALRRRRQ